MWKRKTLVWSVILSLLVTAALVAIVPKVVHFALSTPWQGRLTANLALLAGGGIAVGLGAYFKQVWGPWVFLLIAGGLFSFNVAMLVGKPDLGNVANVAAVSGILGVLGFFFRTQLRILVTDASARWTGRLQRIPVELPYQATVDGHSSEGLVLNITRRGCYLRTADYMPIGTPFDLCIYVRGQPVQVQARVAWENPHPHGYGVAFERLPWRKAVTVWMLMYRLPQPHSTRMRLPADWTWSSD